MVYKKNGLNKILNECIKHIKKRIKIQKIILFGSYAEGTPRKVSDIDLAVISPAFDRMNDFERIRLLLDCVHEIPQDVPLDIEPHGFTPQEYNLAGPFDFISIIKQTGKIVYGR